jgi:hypothetical protein
MFRKLGLSTNLLIFISVFMTGCFGLGKRDDAIDPFQATVKKFASTIDYGTTLSRSSGEVFLLRLTTLFPQAGASAYLTPVDFDPLNSTQLNHAMSSFERSMSPISQMALRNKATGLCNQFADPNLQTQGALFSTQAILAPGESLPQDPAQAIGLIVARNVWLDLYKSDAPEVATLASVYSSVKAATAGQGANASESQARQAVCMAAIGAPQFWIGNATAGDPLRRAALEIGRQIPTMSDIDAYISRELTLSDYVKRLQSTSGYERATHSWLREWLGLREPLPGNTLNNDVIRGNAIAATQTGGLSWLGPHEARIDPGVGGNYLTPGLDRCGDSLCYSNSAVRVQTPQAFDPRTVMIFWQHKNPVIAGALETVGAWVHNDPATITRYNQVSGLTPPNAADLTQIDTQLCTLPMADPDLAAINKMVNALWSVYSRDNLQISASMLKKDPANPLQLLVPYQLVDNTPNLTRFKDYYHWHNPTGWFKCDGKITLANGGKATVHLEDFTVPTLNTSGKFLYPSAALVGTPIQTFGPGDRIVHRYAPGGEQNGASEVRLWYSGTKVWINNAFDRYRDVCFYRPPLMDSGTTIPIMPGGYGEQWTAAFGIPSNGYGQPTDSLAHPSVLNVGMRCGAAVYSEIIKDDPAYREDLAFPRGYDLATQLINPNVTPVVGDLAVHTRIAGGSGTSAELAAVNSLNDDIRNEPMYLLDYILKQNLSYKELLTANFTVGREELELTYRNSAHYMAAYPPGFSPVNPSTPSSGITAGNAASGGPVSRVDFRVIQGRPDSNGSRPAVFDAPAGHQVQDLPIGLIRGTHGYFYAGIGMEWLSRGQNASLLDDLYRVGGNNPTWGPVSNANSVIYAPTMAGVLTMAAFRFPLGNGASVKLRTLADRYFVRLMCGQPDLSIFNPDSSQEALHSQYVPNDKSVNKAVNSHLSKEKGCFNCHINMDPLASALAVNFAKNVQIDENTAIQGEMGRTGRTFHWGAMKGTGAVLGQQVSGVREVARVVADSRQFAKCTVQNAFSSVFGRPPGFADTRFVTTETDKFMSHYNFNLLIQELVDSPNFTERD